MLEIMASTSSAGTTCPGTTYHVTRELRLPLTAIHGTLRLVAGGALGPLTPEASELLAIAGRSCAQLISAIDDLDPLSHAAQVRAGLLG